MKVSEEIELPSNRKFGLFFTIIFFITGVYFFKESKNVGVALFIVSVGFFAATVLKPLILLPLNKLWLRFGLLLGMLVSPIVLAIIFFGMFTPIALIMRLYGRDELRLKLNNSVSFWKSKAWSEESLSTFKNQF